MKCKLMLHLWLIDDTQLYIEQASVVKTLLTLRYKPVWWSLRDHGSLVLFVRWLDEQNDRFHSLADTQPRMSHISCVTLDTD